MSLDDIQTFTESLGVCLLATTDGERPGVRPMSGWAWIDGEFWMASGRHSNKVHDLLAHPKAEVCFINQDQRHLRIAGLCEVSENQDDKTRLWNLLPGLKNYIKTPEDPGYVVLRLKPTIANMMGPTDMAYTDLLQD
jgi:general stress protein 26